MLLSPFRARIPVTFFLAILFLFGVAACMTGRVTQTFAQDYATVASGLDAATAMAFAPDGRLFILEQEGDVRIVKNDQLLPEPFAHFDVNASGERGLLGIAFDPAFAQNGYVYFYRTTSARPLHNQVVRVTAVGDQAIAGSERVIVDLDPLSGANNHNGGAIHFGVDGKLYIATGDNANGTNAQSLTTTLGKILRINADGSIPEDNPFWNQTSGNNRAIFSYGLRNPFTFTVHPVTGRMLINDVGESDWEEINESRSGANYGWPATEGATNDSRFTSPLHAYDHDDGCAIVGGAFLFAGLLPDMREEYAFSDYCGGWIRAVDIATGTVRTLVDDGEGRVGLAAGPDGRLYDLQRNAVGRFAASVISAPTPALSAQPPIPLPAPTPTPMPTPTLTPEQASSTPPHSPTPTSGGRPQAIILSPTEASMYRGGEEISFSGLGVDGQGNRLPDSAGQWRIDFHHDTHSHPFMAMITGVPQGSVLIPQEGETSANVWYRFTLTIQHGYETAVAIRDVRPVVARFTLQTAPVSGGEIILDGRSHATPFAFGGVAGMIRRIEAPLKMTSNGTTYSFDRWEHGGGRTQAFTLPSQDTTVTAVYVPVAPEDPCEELSGDVTCDERVDLADLAQLVDAVAGVQRLHGVTRNKNADLSADGKIGILDIVILADRLVGRAI